MLWSVELQRTVRWRKIVWFIRFIQVAKQLASFLSAPLLSYIGNFVRPDACWLPTHSSETPPPRSSHVGHLLIVIRTLYRWTAPRFKLETLPVSSLPVSPSFNMTSPTQFVVLERLIQPACALAAETHTQYD